MGSKVTALLPLAVLLLGGCAANAGPDTLLDPPQPTGAGSPSSETSATEDVTEPAPVPNDWHTIEYGQIAFDVPADWTLDNADPCTGEAIVSPPRVRTSCPPQPSALIIRRADGSPRTGASTRQVTSGDFVVRLTGVDAKTAQAIMASVRTR